MISKDLVVTTKDVVEREPVTFKKYGQDDIMITYANIKCVLSKQDIMDALVSIEEFYKGNVIETTGITQESQPANMDVEFLD